MKVHLILLSLLLISSTVFAQKDSSHRKLFAVNPNEIYDIPDYAIDHDGTPVIEYSGIISMCPNITVSGKYLIRADKNPIGEYKINKHRVKDTTYTAISYYTTKGKLIAEAVITPSNPKTFDLTKNGHTITYFLLNGTRTEDIEHIAGLVY